jgi:hypothetical protein
MERALRLPPPVWLLVVALLASTAVALWAGWGFTVDDALISTRVAHHVGLGHGYRFNPNGEVTDAVTPLGWAYLLAPFSKSGAWAGLYAARTLGLVCALGTALVMAIALHRQRLPLAVIAAGCVTWAACLPFGAWGASGMETALVTLLCSATLLGKPWTFLAASAAAALRPELLPWAFVLNALQPTNGARRRLLELGLLLSGPLLVALVRAYAFGDAAPLSRLAKPSDFGQGVVYALDGALRTALPLWLLSVAAYRTVSNALRAQAVAVLAHAGALAIAGGDWMALYRLYVPILPACFVVGLALLAKDAKWLAGVKLTASTLLAGALLWTHGAAARGVWSARLDLSQRAAQILTDARVVAALDVGWLGATGPFEIVDLAGVTDPNIAWLPGGHTSKRLPDDTLWRRQVDTLVLLTAPQMTAEALGQQDFERFGWARIVERRASQLARRENFVPVAWLPLAHTTQAYVVWKRLEEDTASAALRSTDTFGSGSRSASR